MPAFWLLIVGFNSMINICTLKSIVVRLVKKKLFNLD